MDQVDQIIANAIELHGTYKRLAEAGLEANHAMRRLGRALRRRDIREALRLADGKRVRASKGMRLHRRRVKAVS